VGELQNGDATIMDIHHNGHPAWTVKMVSDISKRWAPLNPDVILLHMGTNNMGLGLQSAKESLRQMDSLLNKIFSLLPQVRVLLATLIGANIFYGGGKHAAYNSGLRQFVTTFAAAGYNISLVDMELESGIGKYCDLTNCCPLMVHPTKIGYAAMAKVWYKHLTNGSMVNVLV